MSVYIGQSSCRNLVTYSDCIQKNCHLFEEQRLNADDIEYPHYPTIQAVLGDSNGALSARSHETFARHVLPNGPPPFRPTSLLMSETSSKILSKIKKTKAFQQMYKSRAYYLFLDVIERLGTFVDKIASKKVQMTHANIVAVQTFINKILQKSGQKLKLKWPLVMLNPNFLRDILSNPTFLVMLFHTIETAYVSLPTTSFWLKPLMRMVKQPSAEKEEQVWWRRKRLYDTLNGLGSSELQPNLKAHHFRQPGREVSVAVPDVVSGFRKLIGLKPPNPTYFKHPPEQYPAPIEPPFPLPPQPLPSMTQQEIYWPQDYAMPPSLQPQQHVQLQIGEDPYASSNQVIDQQTNSDRSKLHSADLVNPTSQDHLIEQSMRGDYSVMSGDWLSPGAVSHTDLMSQGEFDSLDQQEKDRVFREFHGHMQESSFINDLIRKQDEYVDSIVSKSLPTPRRDDAGSNVATKAI